MRTVRTIVAYLLVCPNTALGVALLPVALLGHGGARLVGGVVEIHGGGVAWLLRHATVLRGGASALTLGHAVLGVDPAALDTTREHERVHVRQYERWGPLFIPAYLLSSLVVHLRGGDGYLDNPFEREAYGRAAGT